MTSAIFALIIALMMIVFVVYKSNFCGVKYYVCRKSEIENLLDFLPEDCIIEVWIGRNTYDGFGIGNSPGRNLRNNISE